VYSSASRRRKLGRLPSRIPSVRRSLCLPVKCRTGPNSLYPPHPKRNRNSALIAENVPVYHQNGTMQIQDPIFVSGLYQCLPPRKNNLPAPKLVQISLNSFVINKSLAKSWSKMFEIAPVNPPKQLKDAVRAPILNSHLPPGPCSSGQGGVDSFLQPVHLSLTTR
jgi:hypothetical protein